MAILRAPIPSFYVTLALLGLAGCGGQLPGADAGAPLAAPGSTPPPDSESPNAPEGNDLGAAVDVAAEPYNCQPLLTKVCGSATSPNCQDSSACQAAQLLTTYEPSSCEAAMSDERVYPECGYSPCDLLVEKVCGALDGQGTCAQRPGCPPAIQLRERLTADGGVGDQNAALSSCAAALEDATIFNACDNAAAP